MLRTTASGLPVLISLLLFTACTAQTNKDAAGSAGKAGEANDGAGATGAVSSLGGAHSISVIPSVGGTAMVGVNDDSCMDYPLQRGNLLQPVAAEVGPLVASLTRETKIDLMHGGPVCPNYDCNFDAMDTPSIQAANLPRLAMRDGPRGVRGQDQTEFGTTWAVAEARAASFDVGLEYRVGKAQGEEMRALKYDVALAPTLNTLRHPAWGRAQETYGEDPVLQGKLGAAFIIGMQEVGVHACPKHFAANDTDENRLTVVTEMDEQTLRENYTRPFQIVVEDADPACIMAAYNGIKTPATSATGDFCSENRHLLTDILRTEWGWTGYAISDWWATKKDAAKSANAGLDIEMPDQAAYANLGAAIDAGDVSADVVDAAATRILNARFKFGHFSEAYQNSAPNPAITETQEHRELALETSVKGAVLLKNDGILPIGPGAAGLGFGSPDVKSIVVLGPDANLPASFAEAEQAGPPDGLGDRGSSETNEPYAVSLVQGLQEALPGVTVTTSLSPSAAKSADIVIIPVTMQHNDEGEAFGGGGDRDDLTLAAMHPQHWTQQKPTAFITAAAAENPNVIVVLMLGSGVIVEDWYNSAKAIVQPFYPGQEGGRGIARLLSGVVNFSGKLPFTVATSAADYPIFGNQGASNFTGYLHGYRLFEDPGAPKSARFWFGDGLSYTTYEYSELELLCTRGISSSGRLNVQVTVTNTGNMAGEEIVQLYIGYPNRGAVRRPVKELKAFTRVALDAGESKQVQLSVAARDMAYWDTADNTWKLQTVEHEVLVGPSSDPNKLTERATFSILP